MSTISQALLRIKGDTARFVDSSLIRSLGRQLQLRGRKRLLTPRVTPQLFLRQVLEGNAPVPELRRLTKLPFADSSYCDARQRLPLAFFQRLHAAVLARCRHGDDNDPRALWHGHRVKQTLGMDVLRCQTWRGVWKEMLMFVLVYNLVRRVMLEASRQQEVEAERISFVDAWRWLREAWRGEAIPRLKVNRQRRGRVEPRVKKRRPKQYDLMNKPRAVLRQMLLHNTAPPQEVAA